MQKALDFALGAVGSPYVYGATGRPCQPQYRLEKARQYPAYARSIRKNCPVLMEKAATCLACRYRGRLAYDCAQLVKKALLMSGQRLPSGASSQWKAEGAWAVKLPFSPALAAQSPCVLFRRSEENDTARSMAHVGLSLGDGTAVDARSHQTGVIRSRLSAYPWTDLAIPLGFPLPGSLPAVPAQPMISRPPQADPLELMKGLLPGSRGPAVRALQNRLLALGYPLPRFGADGRYGPETAAALKAFQHTTGLFPDGLAGEGTLARLFPKPPPALPEPWEEGQDAFDFDKEFFI